jgi:hypothetical protein
MPKIFRDLVLLLGPPLVAWAAQDLVPALHDTNPQAAALIDVGPGV